ncbi:MAG: acyl carrier protein [Piscinibacter sp.]|uniref:acyl carrier protein n=1 Tax=Piscinibacter sp. TaxID=1903157 RepID=UPI003D127CBF
MSAADLRAALESWGVDPADLADEHASLLASGVLDSLALFNLSMWLEQQIGAPIDPTSFEVAREWDSIAAILRFIETQRAAPAEGLVLTPAAATEPPERPAPGEATTPHASGDDAGPYRIERYSEQHLPAIGELMTALWSPDALLNREVFRWKYVENPFDAEPLVYLALRDDRVVGMRAFCGSAWRAAGGAMRNLAVADDFVVAEDDRNHGLLARFTDAATADLGARGQHAFLSLSALRVTRLQLLASGSRSLGVLPTVALRPAWLRALDAVASLAKKTPVLWRAADRLEAIEPASRAFERLDQFGKALPLDDGGHAEVGTAPDPAEFAAFVARLTQDERLRHMRDERFFAWRYRNPLHDYRVISARDAAGRLRGYIVLQRGRSAFADQRRVNLVDWAGDSEAVWAGLIQAAVRGGRIAELVTWRNGDAATNRQIDALGFIPADAHQAERGLPCALVREFGEGVHHPLPELGQWDLRMAYTSFA